MTTLRLTVSSSALASFLLFGVMSVASLAGDLSRYREFQLGTDLATVAKQTGTSPSQAQALHRRPALIQELVWHPQPLGWSSKKEAVQEVVFSFFEGRLFRIVVNYDRYEIEGLTTDDMVEAISTTYGAAGKPPALAKPPQEAYGEQEEVLAVWQDPRYRFDLIRSSYGFGFRLAGVLKSLEETAQVAIQEAKRLDDQEAPQRNAARMASEDEASKAKLEKVRLVNKLKFRM